MQPKIEKHYTVSKIKTRGYHVLLIAKSRLKLKKVGKIIRHFSYDLNQVPYDYTEEVTNSFKGLDLTECLKNYGWRFVTLYRRQGSDHPQEKEMQKPKWLSEEAFQIAEKEEKLKAKEKRKDIHI